MIDLRDIEQRHGEALLESVVAREPAAGPRPAVLVLHSWRGRSDSEIEVARRLTALGYVGVACDLYGKGLLGTNADECRALMAPLMEDRMLLRARLLHLVQVVRELPEVDAQRVAAIGFCFGGLCALDLARSGSDVRGIASFHGLFTPIATAKPASISAKVIAFHGWDDPMAPPDEVVALGRELSAAGADWQIHAYGGAMHAFTNPGANDPAAGLLYNERVARRAWVSLERFLQEAFT